MKKLLLTILFALGIMVHEGYCQKGKASQYFGNPIVSDSLSTIFIPTRYNQEFLSSNKIAMWGDYYANIIVYNYKTDSSQKLFEDDTYIEALRYTNNNRYSNNSDTKILNIAGNWVFLLVKNKDTNSNGRIDENDPSILYVTSKNGENLRPLTDESESVESFQIFEEQQFGLIKIQRDTNEDRSFKNEDKDFYYKKINLSDLSFGKGIEIK